LESYDLKLTVYSFALVHSMSDTTYITHYTIVKMNPETMQAQIGITTLTSNYKPMNCNIVTGLKVCYHRGTERHLLPPSYLHSSLPIDNNQIQAKQMLQRWPHLLPVTEKLPNFRNDIPVGLLIRQHFHTQHS